MAEGSVSPTKSGAITSWVGEEGSGGCEDERKKTCPQRLACDALREDEVFGGDASGAPGPATSDSTWTCVMGHVQCTWGGRPNLQVPGRPY